MQTEASLTSAEEIFLRRALPHFMAGKSVEDSLRAVLDDDERLMTAGMSDRQTFYMGGNFSDGRTYTRDAAGVSIRSAMSAQVHAAIRQQAA